MNCGSLQEEDIDSRKNKLQQLLTWEVIESDETWKNYSKEKIETSLHLDEEIFDYLLVDLIDFIK